MSAEYGSGQCVRVFDLGTSRAILIFPGTVATLTRVIVPGATNAKEHGVEEIPHLDAPTTLAYAPTEFSAAEQGL